MSETQEASLPEKDEPALMELGRQARARGDRAAALGFFQQAIAASQAPTRFQPRLDAATELRVLGRLAEAERLYVEILAHDSDNLWALMGSGQCARARGERTAALDFFQKAIAANKTPTQFQPRLDAATELRVLGRTVEAAGHYTDILAQDAENFWALMGLGHCARAAGDRAAALGFFQRAIAANKTPSQVQPRLEAATELRVLGRTAEAEPLYAAVQAQEPGNVTALMGLGHCARAAGDRAAALGFFENAITANKAPTQVQPRLEAAAELRSLGRIAEAAPLYAEIHAQDPDNVPALMGLGHCARHGGDRTAALAFFEKAIAANKNPTQIYPRLEAAAELRALGRIAEAEPLYAEIHAQDPDNVPALMGLGHCARHRGDRDAGLAFFRKAMIQSAPAENFNPHQTVATELRVQGRIAEAEEIYRDILARQPGSAMALTGLGQCARHRGLHDQALAYFEEASAQAPASNIAAAQEAIRELCFLGRFADAEQRAQDLHAQNPELIAPLVSLAQVARAAGRHPLAFERWRQAETSASAADAPSERLSVGLEIVAELRTLGHAEEAEARSQALLQANPENVHVLTALAQCYRQVGRREEALALFQAAARLDPPNVHLHVQIAAELRELGHTEDALALLAEIGQANPGNTAILLERVRIYRQQDLLDEALAEVDRAVDLAPTQPEIQLERADILRAIGQPEEARTLVEQVLAVLPHQQRALDILAEFAGMEMDYETAERLRREAVARSPDRPGTHLALARLLLQFGNLDEALSCIENARAVGGSAADVAADRINILREMGRWQTALAEARAATAAMPWQMRLWEQRLRLEWLGGDRVAIDACFAAAPARTVRDRAQLAYLRGLDASSNWRLDEAIAWQQEALTLNPQLGGSLHELSRLALLRLDIDTARDCLESAARLAASVNRLRGRSANISQTHIGQLADEFRIDSELVDILRPLWPQPPAQRAASLLPLVREYPDSTAVAVMLLIALRQAKMFDQPLTHQATRIPPRIVQFWDNPDVPQDLVPLQESWRTMNPDYQYECFNAQTAGQFLQKAFGTVAYTAFARAREPAQKADIFRLGYLAVLGGVYVDSDDRCLSPLDRWLPRSAALVAYQEDYGTLGNNFLAVEPRSPIIIRALQNAVVAVNRGDNDLLWLSTGPGAVSRAFTQVMAERVDDPFGMLGDIELMNLHALQRISQIHSRLAYKTTANHWMHTAFGRTRTAANRPAPAPPEA